MFGVVIDRDLATAFGCRVLPLVTADFFPAEHIHPTLAVRVGQPYELLASEAFVFPRPGYK
jgi:hypothetical protein